MSSLATPWLVVVFVAGAGATCLAGISLSKTTDALDFRLGLGEELGGILLLAVAGSLPELAITVSAAAQGNLGLAAGNLIGGIAVQTMVLVVCDIVAGRERPLTYLVGALTPVLEGMLVVLVVSGVLMGALLQPSTATRLDVGIQLKGVPSDDRLEASGSFNGMVTHRVRVTSLDQVDSELIQWLRLAYDRS